MKLNPRDYDSLRRLADDFINSTRVRASSKHHDPLDWTYWKLKGSERLLDQATAVVSSFKHFAVVTIVLVLFVLGSAKLVRYEAESLHPAPEGGTEVALRIVPSITIKIFTQLPTLVKASIHTKSTLAKDLRTATRTGSNARPTVAENHSNQSPTRMTFPQGVPIGFDYDEYGRLRGRALQPGEKIQGPQKSRAADTFQTIQKSFSQGR